MFLRPFVPVVLVPLFGLFSPSAFAATHQILQSGITWNPSEITIEVGDTVQWVHSTVSHTVTEGTDDLTPPIGSKLFDEPLTAATPLVSYTFTTAGDVSFYCRPHRAAGMTGVIHVTQATSAPPPVGNVSWSRVKDLYR